MLFDTRPLLEVGRGQDKLGSVVEGRLRAVVERADLTCD